MTTPSDRPSKGSEQETKKRARFWLITAAAIAVALISARALVHQGEPQTRDWHLCGPHRACETPTHRPSSVSPQQGITLKKSTLRDKFAVFLGIAMDIEVALPGMIVQIEALGAFFASYDVIMIENDSSDHTRSILETWSRRNPRVIVETRDFKKMKRPSIAWLALHALMRRDSIRGALTGGGAT